MCQSSTKTPTMQSLLAATVIALVLQVAASQKLPNTFRLCKQNDPQIDDCLKDAVGDAVRRISKKGVQSLGVLPLDPLQVNDISIEQGGGGPVSIKLRFSNLKIYGIGESEITGYKATITQPRLETDSLTPVFRMEGEYSMDGQVLVLPVKGSGKCNITLVNLAVHHDLKGEKYTKDGKVYWKLDRYDIKLEPKRMHTHFDNLFNGDATLGDTMNAFINENWEIIFGELRPPLEEAFGAIFLDITNRIFTKVPFNQIFLE